MSSRDKRVLCLDGGGTRGVASLAALQVIEESTGRLICESFDLIVGVSTGALIASALGLKRMRVAQVRELYYEVASECFGGGAANPVTSGSYYQSDVLAELLREQLGEAPMSTYAPQRGHRPRVVVVSNDITTLPAQRVLFTNYASPEDPWASTPACKAVLSSCSAPLYFPACHVVPGESAWPDTRILIDGAVGHNNPLLISVQQADLCFGRKALQLILSIGTGQRPSAPNPSVGAQSTLAAISTRLSEGYLKSLVSTMSSVAPTLGILKLLAELATDTEQSELAGQLLFPPDSDVLYARVNPDVQERCALDEHEKAVLLALEQDMRDSLQGSIDFARVLTLL